MIRGSSTLIQHLAGTPQDPQIRGPPGYPHFRVYIMTYQHTMSHHMMHPVITCCTPNHDDATSNDAMMTPHHVTLHIMMLQPPPNRGHFGTPLETPFFQGLTPESRFCRVPFKSGPENSGFSTCKYRFLRGLPGTPQDPSKIGSFLDPHFRVYFGHVTSPCDHMLHTQS